jgi:hypothetical protein
LVCVLVDAFRHDYLEHGVTPVLSQVAADGKAIPLKPILGYSDSIRATIFTGTYPDESGYWMEYCYRPESSPFKAGGRYAAIDRFPSDIAQRALKLVLSKAVMPRVAKRRGYESLHLRHFPFRAMPFLDYTLRDPMMDPGALGVPTIFDRLSEAGMRWAYISSASLKRKDLLAAVSDVHPDTALVFVYLHQVDMASHLWGVESRRFWRSVAKTDALVGEVLQRARARLNGDPNVLLFSDHGMSQIKHWIGIPELLRHPKFGRQFCCALDATMVRLWYFDDDAAMRNELRALVAGRFPGHWLDERELKDMHVDFADRRYGDEMYLIEPGTVVHPNFHSYLRPKAMHAYHPDEPEQQGILIASEEPAAMVGDTAQMIDIAPLLWRFCDLPTFTTSTR